MRKLFAEGRFVKWWNESGGQGARGATAAVDQAAAVRILLTRYVVAGGILPLLVGGSLSSLCAVATSRADIYTYGLHEEHKKSNA